MTTSEQALAAIKGFEGFRALAYVDSSGVATIGYGETRSVHPGMYVTEHEADLMLRAEVQEIEKELRILVKVPLNQGQYDALVDFCYNLGAGSLSRSTLLVLLNAKDYTAASQEIPKWCRDRHGNEIAGLKARRFVEQRWFDTGVTA